MEQVDLNEVEIGQEVHVQTRNTLYKMKKIKDRQWMIEGGSYFEHPQRAFVNGCTFGGSMIKWGFLEVGMYMEFGKLDIRKNLVSSCIRKISIE